MNTTNESAPQGILQLCLSDAWGGLEMVAFETAFKLKAHGVFVTTACPPDSPLEHKMREAGLDVLTIQRRNKYFCPNSIQVLRRALKTGRYSGVLIEQMNELWQVVPALIGFRNVRLVGISHTFLAITKKDLLHRLLYGRLNHLVALTEIHKRNLVEKLPVRDARVAVLPNAVDVDKFNPHKRSDAFRRQYLRAENEILIGVVSRLDAGKGVREVVFVAANLKKHNLPFRLIMVGTETAGEGGTKAKLEADIRELGLSEHVFLIGHRTDVDQIIASLDVLLMPSPTETFGRVIIEAMASGVAVVASSGGGVANIIQDGENGLLAQPLSVEEMTRGIERCGREPQLRHQLAERGLVTARDRYDGRKLDQQLFSLLGLSV